MVSKLQVGNQSSLPLTEPLNEKDRKNLHESVEKIAEYVGYFYKIKNSENKTIGSLCGTLHRCRGSLFGLSQPINKAILKADTVYLEHYNPRLVIDEGRKNAYKMLQECDSVILESAVSRYEHEIDSCVNNFGWAAIKSKHCFDQLSPFKKFELCRRHYEIIMARELDKRDTEVDIQGMDDFLCDISKELKKNTKGLQKNYSALYQEMINIARRSAPDIYLNPSFHREKRQFEIGCEEWLSGKIQVPRPIEDLSVEENRMKWELTCGRSEQIAAAILEHLQSGQGRAFYAFGFSHLYNQKSVISSLESHGFKVVRR